MENAIAVRDVSVLQLAERRKQRPRSGTVAAVTIYVRHDLLLLLNITVTESDVLLGFIKVGIPDRRITSAARKIGLDLRRLGYR